MEEIHDLTDNEKELLTLLGKFPDISVKELSTHISYQWASTVSKTLKKLKELHIMGGPMYDVDFGKLSRNPTHWLFCIIESAMSHEAVLSYLRLIEPLRWVYPVLSPHKNVLNVGYISSDDDEVKALLRLLKNNNIITDFIVRTHSHERIVENPNFSGEVNPSLDNLLDPCELPDLSCGHHDTNWNECDIAVLPYLETGYKETKLIEIMKAEKKRGNNWTYEQLKYSREKMVRNNLIKKRFTILPFSPLQCAVFMLFVKTDDTLLTRRILHNFARGAQVYKHYVLCGDWGQISCTSHPHFLTNLMHNLDKTKEITRKELYPLRSVVIDIPARIPTELRYFDIDKQTLVYPYPEFEKKIKEKLENEQ